MNILYITAETPWGRGETFVLEEMLELNRIENVELTIIPRTPPREFFHTQGTEIMQKAVWLPLLSVRFLPSLIKNFINNRFWLCLKTIIVNSKTVLMSIKNLAVVSKAVYIADYIMKNSVDHIHVHWGSTTATMGYVISELTGVPWSFTVHRWDITEDNLLRQKVDSAQFVRSISATGREELLSIVGNEYEEKVHCIHMGVAILPENVCFENTNQGEFIVACPANIIPVKGHKYLIKACDILRNRGVDFRCLIIGDGVLEDKLKQKVDAMGLTDYIHFMGRVAHHELMNMYQQGRVNVVVLPSINTDDGEHEGIPVALMEAMMYGIPVVSTRTGGIPELLHDGAGILVQEKNANELADAIQTLINDPELQRQTGLQGRIRVKQGFNLRINTHKLLKHIKAREEE